MFQALSQTVTQAAYSMALFTGLHNARHPVMLTADKVSGSIPVHSSLTTPLFWVRRVNAEPR